MGPAARRRRAISERQDVLSTIAGRRRPTGHNMSVEKTVKVFAGLEDADKADARDDAAMSPEERLNILIELRDSGSSRRIRLK
jgi:hypothetical protein